MDEISLFVQQLLLRSSASASVKSQEQQQPPTETTPSDAQRRYFPGDLEEVQDKSPAAPPPSPPRTLSKRRRTPEVHNLSEKRRRSRINEKLRALQSLIPNSNKTDKASMLDEAINYLKQLQLEVQMISLRNGINVHPFCPRHAGLELVKENQSIYYDQTGSVAIPHKQYSMSTQATTSHVSNGINVENLLDRKFSFKGENYLPGSSDIATSCGSHFEWGQPFNRNF